MTQNTQTTSKRIQAIIDKGFKWNPGPPGNIAKQIAAEIDALTAERDEALAKVADWEREEGLAEIANTQINLHYAEVAKNSNLTAQLALEQTTVSHLQAEAERLRPAAQAWELLEQMYHNTGNSLAASYTKACIDKAARARAAKVTP